MLMNYDKTFAIEGRAGGSGRTLRPGLPVFGYILVTTSRIATFVISRRGEPGNKARPALEKLQPGRATPCCVAGHGSSDHGYQRMALMALLTLSCSGCAVVTVADAAVSVAATTVKVGAAVVETAVDVTAEGVGAVIGSDKAD